MLIEYLKLCQKHQIHLISDEIYALSIWENEDDPKATPFTSVLGLDFAGIIDPNLIHVLWGVSKVIQNLVDVDHNLTSQQDFGANGLRVACTITQNEPMRMSLITHS